MKTFSLLSLVAGLAMVFVGFSYAPEVPAADAWAKECARKQFKTKLVADACKSGGQKAAKKAMKKFVKAAKKKDGDVNCKSCHVSLKGDYKLKPDGLKLFKKFGGK